MPLAYHPLVWKVGAAMVDEKKVWFSQWSPAALIYTSAAKKEREKKQAAEKSGLFLRAAGCREGDTVAAQVPERIDAEGKGKREGGVSAVSSTSNLSPR